MKPRRHPKHDKLHMFRTPNGKSDNWYCGFHHAGQFIRSSTRTTAWGEAVVVAESWYLDLQYEIRHGFVTMGGRKRFEAVAITMLARMKAEGRSVAYRKVLTNYLRRGGYVHSFFGSMLVRKINTRTWDDFRLWLGRLREEDKKDPLSERSMHQLKNAVRLVLKQAYVERHIDDVPTFVDPLRSKQKDYRPRVYFKPDEYKQLLKASRANIERHFARKSRWQRDAEELHDYIVFMANTGLRVSEAGSLRIKDVILVTTNFPSLGSCSVCQITINFGKRGAHPPTRSFPAAAIAFQRIVARRSITQPPTSGAMLFLKHHREAFKRLLRSNGLYLDTYGRKRDFVSLRHSHICFRILAGDPVFSIARATRTSPLMIDQHYAKSLMGDEAKIDADLWLLA